MPTAYPGANDNFKAPTSPATTTLSSAGDSTRNHAQSHQDLGDAIMALQANAALLTHDHSNTESRPTAKLKQANTHQSPDTDASSTSLHHTLGTGANQASPGNHTHTFATPLPTGTFSSASPYISLGVGQNAASIWTVSITVPSTVTSTRIKTDGWVTLFPTGGGGQAGQRTYNTGYMTIELIDSGSNSLYADSTNIYGSVQDDGSGNGYFPSTVPFTRIWPTSVGPGTYRLRFRGWRTFTYCGVSAYQTYCSTTFLNAASTVN